MRKKIIAGSLSVSLLLGAGAALPEGVFDLGADIAVCAAVSGDFDHKVLSDGTAELYDTYGVPRSVCCVTKRARRQAPFSVHRFAPHFEGACRLITTKQPAQIAQTAFGYNID